MKPSCSLLTASVLGLALSLAGTFGCELSDDSCMLYTAGDRWSCRGAVLVHASRKTCQKDEDITEVDCAALGKTCVENLGECVKTCAADSNCEPGAVCSSTMKTASGESTCQQPHGA